MKALALVASWLVGGATLWLTGFLFWQHWVVHPELTDQQFVRVYGPHGLVLLPLIAAFVCLRAYGEE